MQLKVIQGERENLQRWLIERERPRRRPGPARKMTEKENGFRQLSQ